MATDILSPEGQAGGNLLSPGHGTMLPHGLVWPHGFPKPEDFRLPQVAIPSVSRATVSSHVTGAPPASGGPSRLLSQISAPMVTVARPKRPTGLISGARKVSRNAIGSLPEFVRRPVSKLGENTGMGRIKALGIRWG